MIIYLLFSLFSQERIEYMLPNIVEVQQVIELVPQKVLLVNEKDILQLDVLSKDIKKLGERGGNEFVGYDNGLLFCRIEHYIIDSEDEFSTKFTVLDEERDVVKEFQFFETIRPLYLDNNMIVATTAVDFLEKHFYKISLDDLVRKRNVTTIREDVFGNVWVSYSTRDMAKIMIATLKLNLKIMLNIIPMNVPRPAFTP